MKTIAGTILVVALGAGLPAAAQKECSKAEAAAAEKAADKIVNYANLLRAYKDYRHCDAGAVEENFTDAILRLLVEWKNVDTIASELQADPEYKKFIYKHLDSPAAKDDRESIYSRAKNSCPPIQDEFCKDLMAKVRPAGGGASGLAPAPAIQPASAPPKK